MNWTEIKIDTTSPGIEHVCAALISLGIEGFIIEDANDFREFLEGTVAHWDYVDESLMALKDAPAAVKIYLPQTPEGMENLALVKESLSRLKTILPLPVTGTLAVSTVERAEEDWANNWKQYYKNILIEDKLVISPLWEEVPPALQNKTIVKMDPGMAFGTGTHETTRLCLQLLCRSVTGGEKMLDLGCGSGILGICALKLGAASVSAVDIDPLAAQIAKQNAGLNDLSGPAFLTCYGNVLSDPDLQDTLFSRRYDLICANIVADVILPLFPLVKPALVEGGLYLVSGIIDGRTQEVEGKAKEWGFILKERLFENDWNSYLFTI